MLPNSPGLLAPLTLHTLDTVCGESFLIPEKYAAVGNRRIAANNARKQRSLRFRTIGVRSSRRNHGFAAFSENEKTITDQCHCPSAVVVNTPCDLAGCKLDAAQALTIFLPAVKSVDVSVFKNTARIVV